MLILLRLLNHHALTWMHLTTHFIHAVGGCVRVYPIYILRYVSFTLHLLAFAFVLYIWYDSGWIVMTDSTDEYPLPDKARDRPPTMLLLNVLSQLSIMTSPVVRNDSTSDKSRFKSPF